MRILVTGAAGFIGSHTCNRLEKANHQVLAVDNLSTGRIDNLRGFRGTFALVDVRDQQGMANAFEDFKPQAVLHLAAQSAITVSTEDPIKDLQVNAIGTLNLLDLSKKHGVVRFVFSSTSAVYREEGSPSRMTEAWWCEPSTPYGISKLAAESYIRAMFPNHVILRYGNVYGPRQRSIGENQVVARALAHLTTGTDFKVVGDGKQKRDFVYVEDVALANMYALTDGDCAGTYNAAMGTSHSVNEVLSILEDLRGISGYGWNHTSKNDPRGDVGISTMLIRREMGWSPMISLKDGLRRTSQWWNEIK